MKRPSKKIYHLIVFGLTLGFSWFTLLFQAFTAIGLILWFVGLAYLFIEKSRFKWYLLFLSTWVLPSFYSFALGSKDYFKGEATIISFGKPSEDFWNLDSDLRVWNSTSGCIVKGNEILTQTPNNLAVRLWTYISGTQNGVYKGYYPSSNETDTLINNGVTVSFNKHGNKLNFRLKGESISLFANNHISLDFRDNLDSAKVTVINNSCIAFRALGDTLVTQTILADKSNGQLFAKYVKYKSTD